MFNNVEKYRTAKQAIDYKMTEKDAIFMPVN